MALLLPLLAIGADDAMRLGDFFALADLVLLFVGLLGGVWVCSRQTVSGGSLRRSSRAKRDSVPVRVGFFGLRAIASCQTTSTSVAATSATSAMAWESGSTPMEGSTLEAGATESGMARAQ